MRLLKMAVGNLLYLHGSDNHSYDILPETLAIDFTRELGLNIEYFV
jgi:hypothetical protein